MSPATKLGKSSGVVLCCTISSIITFLIYLRVMKLHLPPKLRNALFAVVSLVSFTVVCCLNDSEGGYVFDGECVANFAKPARAWANHAEDSLLKVFSYAVNASSALLLPDTESTFNVSHGEKSESADEPQQSTITLADSEPSAAPKSIPDSSAAASVGSVGLGMFGMPGPGGGVLRAASPAVVPTADTPAAASPIAVAAVSDAVTAAATDESSIQWGERVVLGTLGQVQVTKTTTEVSRTNEITVTPGAHYTVTVNGPDPGESSNEVERGYGILGNGDTIINVNGSGKEISDTSLKIESFLHVKELNIVNYEV